MPVAPTSVSWAPHRDPLTVTIPPPDETLDLTMGDGATIRVRRYGHLLQIQKPEECRRAMLRFLDDLGIR